ncbi:MAG: hypothetical protein IIU36_03580 [Firmicutes bacterium]|nr:hypothetical protein [Bacillota bacterium]
MKMAEATILVPMTILIIVSIIGLMMGFYDDLGQQIEKHTDERAKIYEEKVW